MICDFTEIGKSLICRNCGRRIPITKDLGFPMAKCRIPEHYRRRSRYLNNYKTMGVGDMLGEIIKKIGYSYQPYSRSRTRLTLLNTIGIDWCEKNKRIIAAWIQSEAARRNIMVSNALSMALVRLAIRQTKNQDIKV